MMVTEFPWGCTLSYCPRLWVMNSQLCQLDLHSTDHWNKIDGKNVEQEGDLYMFKTF